MMASQQEAPIPEELDVVELAKLIAEAAAKTQASDISIIDLRGLVDYTDAFVLCSARNRRQVAAIAEAVRLEVKRTYSKHALGVEGLERGQWVLVDFGDVVCHVFDQSMRGFYDLDGLWADAPRIEGPAQDASGEPQFF